MFHSSSNDPRNLFKSDNVYRYAAFACLDSRIVHTVPREVNLIVAWYYQNVFTAYPVI